MEKQKNPIAFPTKKEFILVACGTLLFFILTGLFIGIRVDHVALIGLFLALFFASGPTRKLAIALIPFMVFGISYDWMRVFPNYEVNPIDVKGLYETEKALFGIPVNGQILTPNEYFALQMCKDSLVLLPFGRMSLMLKKDVALEIPYAKIRKVTITEDMLNWRIELDTEEGLIALSAQQKELSEWRHSGTLSVGMSGLGSGITGTDTLKISNWHRANLDATLADLEALPREKEETA